MLIFAYFGGSTYKYMLHNAKIQIELTALFSVVSGGFGGPIEGTKANFPLTLVVLWKMKIFIFLRQDKSDEKIIKFQL